MIQKRLTIKPCHKCRSWRDCRGKPYYELREISFCRYQVRWVITEFISVWGDAFIVMRDTWPGNPQETGYTEAPPTQHAIKASAPYESPLQIVAEVRNRLDKTNGDGRELVLMLTGRREPVELSSRARDALSYCSGWKRKASEYREWLADRERRHREFAGKP